jgi:hypothetical protein
VKRLTALALCLAALPPSGAWAVATVVTAQSYTRSGYDHTTNAAAADTTNGDKWLNTGAETLVVTAGGSSCTVTIAFGPNATIDGSTPANKTVVVGANKTAVIGTFAPGLYNDASGYVTCTFSAAATISVVKPG